MSRDDTRFDEFTLPFLLEAEARHSSIAPGLAAMPRMSEPSSVRIARLTEGRSFESMDELNAEVERASERGLFDLPADVAAGRELTPLERAQEFAYDAMEATGRLQIKRARQALAVSPDCADAWVILAESASTPDVALERYEQGVAAGIRAIGAKRFEELQGEFWPEGAIWQAVPRRGIAERLHARQCSPLCLRARRSRPLP